MRTTLTDEEQRSFAELQARIKVCNRAVPELRITLPSHCMSLIPYLSLNIEICTEYYFKCAELRLDENAGNKIAVCLATLAEQYPLEWRVCAWKNDFIAEIMLEELKCSGEKRKKAADDWLRWYRKREQKLNRQTDLFLSPKRMAASSAVLELELLELIDENPEFWIVPGFRVYATFVNWLNRNWNRVAARKRGSALLNMLVSEFRKKRQDLAVSDSDLSEICGAYQSIESSHPPGRVPTSQVVLTLVARKHEVSPRLVTKVRAEMNKQRRAHETNKKARS